MIRFFAIFLLVLTLGYSDAYARECTSVSCYTVQATDGDVAAADWLGDYYFTGEIIKPDYAKAERWYLKAGEGGIARAQIRLGFMYAENHFPGVDNNLEKGEYWFRKAAEQGDVKGQFRLGNFYIHYLKPPDYEKAVKWLTKSAEQCNGAAQYDLARIYKDGKNGASDPEKSFEYMEQAAKNDIRPAQMAIAIQYEKDGRFKDALFWAEKLASNRGNQRYWTNKVEKLKQALAAQETP